jgi:glycosyltransferase involved in cell wall biosynthesis
MAAAIRRTIHEHQIDLIYVNGPRVLPAVAGVPRPVLFHAHSRVGAFYARKLIHWSLRSTRAAVVAVSEFIARDYPGAHVIYNGIPDLGFPARTYDRKPARIGIIGRIAPEKGQLDFVRAARQIPRAEFFVYGEPMFADSAYDRKVRAEAEGAPIRFCGWTGDVGCALHDLDILVVPSGPNEAATRVIPEAFSAGTPVIAYAAGGIPEIIDHGRTGILTETPDAGTLAKAINRLIQNPTLRARMSAEGRKEWNRRFTLQRFQTAVCDLIVDHATRHKRHARSAQVSAGGAANAEPVPTHPE